METPRQQPHIQSPHSTAISQLTSLLDTHITNGLERSVADHRIVAYGENAFPSASSPTMFVLFLRQFASPLQWILMIATVLAFSLGQVVDGSIVAFVLLLNGTIGAYQEGRAERTLALLHSSIQMHSVVVRGGKREVISSAKLVPGDLIILSPGDRVPADARLVASDTLLVNESILTGESIPVEKYADEIPEQDADISEQKTMIFQGTFIQGGTATAIVIHTGNETEFGALAESLIEPRPFSPLEIRIKEMTNLIMVWVLGIVGGLFLLGLILGHSLVEMVTLSISLMVSVIPEGLPIAITVILAHGVKRMASQNVLVKRLSAVETLGRTNILALDKTGTLTQNKLTISQVYVAGNMYTVTGVGYERSGNILIDGVSIDISEHPILQECAKFSALSANAEIFRKRTGSEEEVTISGDPTEAAFLVFGEKLGFNKEILFEKWPHIDQIPFSFKNKYFATTHEIDGEPYLVVTGSPEVILARSSHFQYPTSRRSIGPKRKEELARIVETMASSGLRVLALAVRKDAPRHLREESVDGLTLIGFLGMIDALRTDAGAALEALQSAGLRTVMITGDAPRTAAAIARDAGIMVSEESIVTGSELGGMSQVKLLSTLNAVSVFARVEPTEKLEIVKAFQRSGDIVAMTGDGVNDVPALHRADLGLAMGGTGSALAQSAADVILLDDNIGSLVVGVKEGRAVFASIKKVLMYLLATNLSELAVILIAIVISVPLPLLPAQIIWLNLITDTFLAVAIGTDRTQSEEELELVDADTLLPMKNRKRMLVMGAIFTIGTFFAFMLYKDVSYVYATTMALTTMVLFQLFSAWTVSSGSQSITSIRRIRFNSWLFQSGLLVIVIHFLAINTPFIQPLLGVTGLSFKDILLSALIASSVILVDETYKRVTRKTPLFS